MPASRTVSRLVRSAALGACATLLASAAAVACTRDEAFNRMMALGQYGMKLQATLPDPLKDPAGYNAKYPRITEFGTRLSAVGKVLADQKYDDACATYDALARDYHVDYAAQNVRPLSALEAEAKNPPKDGCDLAESARRSVWLTQAFKKRADAEQLGRDDWQQFGKDTQLIGPMMQQDPQQACEMIDTVARKYRLQR